VSAAINLAGITLSAPLTRLVAEFVCPQYLHALREAAREYIPISSARRPGVMIRSMAGYIRDLPGPKHKEKKHDKQVMSNILTDMRLCTRSGWECRFNLIYRFMLAVWEPATH